MNACTLGSASVFALDVQERDAIKRLNASRVRLETEGNIAAASAPTAPSVSAKTLRAINGFGQNTEDAGSRGEGKACIAVANAAGITGTGLTAPEGSLRRERLPHLPKVH